MPNPGEDRHNPPDENDAFLQVYWSDVDAGAVKSQDDYLRAFPGAEETIRREFEEASRQVDHYRLETLIGRGGQATVWRAYDQDLRRPVALKLLTASGSEAHYRRFLREAMLVARLEHPSICSVYGNGVCDRGYYIVMQLIGGRSLLQTLRKSEALPEPSSEWHVDASDPSRATERTEPRPGRWPRVESGAGRNRKPESFPEVATWLRYFAQVARALDHAHSQGVIHRDLKPGNLMVQPDGTPVILDFGLARDLKGQAAHLTRTGDVLGTPAYMSPEQLEGERVGPATDLWSLGVSLYECLAGRLPFTGEGHNEFFRAVLRQEPDPPSDHNAILSTGVDRVILKALAKRAADRYGTALEFASDLDDLALGRTPEHASCDRPLITITHLDRSSLRGRVQRFRRSRISLGRQPESDVAFDPQRDSMVSGTHAEIVLSGGRLSVRDKGSRNGTHVNGEQVTECELRSGAIVVLGPVELGAVLRIDFEGVSKSSDTTGIQPTQWT